MVIKSILLRSGHLRFPTYSLTLTYFVFTWVGYTFYFTGFERRKISGDVLHFISMSGASFSTWLAFHHTACGADNEATGSGKPIMECIGQEMKHRHGMRGGTRLDCRSLIRHLGATQGGRLRAKPVLRIHPCERHFWLVQTLCSFMHNITLQGTSSEKKIENNSSLTTCHLFPFSCHRK